MIEKKYIQYMDHKILLFIDLNTVVVLKKSLNTFVMFFTASLPLILLNEGIV